MLKPPVLKRLTGVVPDTSQAICQALEEHLPHGGRRAKYGREDRLLMTLTYWRECRTYAHIAQTYGLSESAVCRTVHTVENALLRSGEFTLPDKKSKLHPLTREQKAGNRQLSSERFVVEHITRGLKIFRILAGCYRTRRKRFGLRFNLVAALYNLGRPT